MPVGIHSDVQNADDLQLVVPFSVEEYMRSGRDFHIARAHVDRTAPSFVPGERIAGITDLIGVTIGLIGPQVSKLKFQISSMSAAAAGEKTRAFIWPQARPASWP